MTINRPARYAATAASALVAWIALLAAIAVLLEPTPTVLAFGPRDRTVAAAVAAGAAIVDLGPAVAQLRSARPSFARTLYAAGAWLVLPAPEGGCLGGS